MKKTNLDKFKELMINPYIKMLLHSIVIINITFILVFISEFIVRGDATDVLRWMTYFTMEFTLTFVLVLCILLATTFLFNHIGYGYLVTSLLICTISIVNFYKLDIKGEQLSVQDFALVSELATMAGDLQIHVSPHIIWSVIFALVIFLMLREINFVCLKNRKRVLSLILCGILATGVYENIYAKQRLVKNSFLLTLVNSAHASNIEEPTGYTKERVEKILDTVTVSSKVPDVKPNVIMIMDESFFDINTMENLELSENPMKYFKTYQKEFTSGNIIGPKIGGYTAQTEYEVLTGNSTDFTGVSNVAYIRYIKPKINSLVSVFKKAGYTATAIHPYDRKFYSRDKVYKDMGFDNFITQEDFKNSERMNEYIMDKEAFKKLIESYEKNQSQPFFAHVVTMQNHTPYGKISNPTITVQNTNISQETKDVLESYASCLKATDEAIKDLVDYFSKVKEPTVIMIFGDHIPILGESVYEEMNYLEFNKPEDYRNGASTPFLIWDNYNLPKTQYQYIDSSYLGALLLDKINFKQNQYFNYVYNQLDQLKAYHTEFFVNGSGKFLNHENLDNESKQLLEDMWQVQYDRLFGKGYGQKE